MAHLAGKYQLVKNENLVQYFTAIGLPEDKAKLADAAKPTLEITVDGKNITLKTEIYNVTLVLDQAIEEHLGPNKILLKSTAKLDGDILVVDSKLESTGQSGSRTYKLSGDELLITMTILGSSNTAKRHYKKL